MFRWLSFAADAVELGVELWRAAKSRKRKGRDSVEDTVEEVEDEADKKYG